ncbi:extracellular solute-binding protein [Actinomadura rayongensis]|uniref:Extracellular solute-binding protein n=1 Tax=Actinomadura rayongensis TaxID=1429076 RepID=A0A6I4W907_9ACTN|nr:extracellular solute-binding protein [Actinomadura rayongensis]MXQ63554.1 extracellular solute-binding protein [Actinomadura rayongensis]
MRLKVGPGAARGGRRTGAAAGLAALVLALGGCGGGEARKADAAPVAGTVGGGEGELNLVVLPGDIENGGTDRRVDWVTPFQERTGCTVSWRTARDAQEMTDLVSNPARRYDGVLAPPEVAGRLVAGRQAAPVNTDLVDGYKKLEPKLRSLLRQDGKVYGVPYTWGSNVLMYDARTVAPPSSWGAVYDPGQARRYAGKLVMRDTPLSVADVALYLKQHDRELKIKDVYALSPRQLAAVRGILEKQRPSVRAYWKTPAQAVSAFAADGAVLGVGSPYQADVLGRAGHGVRTADPAEGVTGWATAWMIGARAAHPNCMYEWLRWTATPDVQQQVAEWSGVAPANPQACSGERAKSGFCVAYRVGDRDRLDRIVFARTPTAVCGGGPDKGERKCTDYIEWTRVWIEATKLAK